LSKFLELLEITISRRTRLSFVAAQIHRRVDVMLSRSEVAASAIWRPLTNLTPHKKMLAFVIAGMVGLALLLLLLELSVRRELAKEVRDAARDAIPGSSASVQEVQFEDLFPIELTRSTSLQSVDQLGVTGTTSSAEYAQTFGQVFRDPVPLPRSRKPRLAKHR
jgi:hypothetical protein